MNYDEFKHLVKAGESKNIDFKIQCDAFNSHCADAESAKAELVKDICAMANNRGTVSRLIIGVSNDRQNIKTVTNDKLTDDNLQTLCAEAISPPPTVKLITISLPQEAGENAGKRCVIIQVGPHSGPVYRLNKDFISPHDTDPKKRYHFRRNEVWVRRGATSGLASPEETAKLKEGHKWLWGMVILLAVAIFFPYTPRKEPQRSLVETPTADYSFISHAERYQEGLEIHGVKWRQSFSRHSFVVVNRSDLVAMEDFRLFILLPAGIVSHKFLTLEGCQDVVASQYNPAGGIGGKDGVIYKVQDYYRNDLMVSVARLGPGGRLTLELILEYRGGNDNAGWCEINYCYGTQPNQQRNGIRNRIAIQAGDPLSLRVDTSTNMADLEIRQQMIMMPDRPFVQDGVLVNSIDFDYPARPNAAHETNRVRLR